MTASAEFPSGVVCLSHHPELVRALPPTALGEAPNLTVRCIQTATATEAATMTRPARTSARTIRRLCVICTLPSSLAGTCRAELPLPCYGAVSRFSRLPSRGRGERGDPPPGLRSRTAHAAARFACGIRPRVVWGGYRPAPPGAGAG